MKIKNKISKEDHVARYLSRFLTERDVEMLTKSAAGGQESAESPMERDCRMSANAGLRAIRNGESPTREQTAGLEALILPKIRPVLDVVDGKFNTDHPLWLHLNEDGKVRKGLLNAVASVGRIELPGNPSYPYGGTGFVVGENLVMTNRHVAAIFTIGSGRQVSIKPGHRAGIDFLRELDRPTGPTFKVKQVVMIHPYWDMALLEVDGVSALAKPLHLSLREVKDDGAMITVAAIGYPAFDPRNNTNEQNDLFRRVFGVKRLQPGTLGGHENTESFGKMVPAFRHNCSTLGGNSGSALVDLETGGVVALHFGGRYQVTNYGVPAFELARDQRVLDAGVRFAKGAPGGVPPWNAWWNEVEASAADSLYDDRQMTHTAAPPKPASSNLTPLQLQRDGSINIMVPLYVTLRLGDDAKAYSIEAGTAQGRTPPDDLVERLAMPWHDEDYASRKGYSSDFLGTDLVVTMPQPADIGVVARTKTGDGVLHYENFSIVMHAARRMALITASNVTAQAKLKKPEAGKVYTRKALSGLDRNDQEKWFPDPRLSESYQLPDVFYTKDDGAFDKGHIVRREDVAWGENYDVIRRANGDTYHVTNCSPQVAGFNRSALGDDNWGDFEDHVLKGAASERYCQFAGPILASDDEVFVGSGGSGVRLRIKIPSRYWKVIVVRKADGLASYGFTLEQDLTDVPLEFAVPENFSRFMVPLVKLQQGAGIQFPQAVLDADQYRTEEALELSFFAGVKLRAGDGGTISEGVIY